MTKKVLVLANSIDAVPADSRNAETILICGEKELERQAEALAQNTFDEVRCYIVPSETLQAAVFNVLKPKAKLLVEGLPDRQAGQELTLNLRIQGFTDIMAAKDPGTGSRFVVCERPDWDIGSTAKLSIPSSSAVKITAVAEDDLIDEDALLAETEADVQSRPENMDCGADNSGKRRACANCTCGLADKVNAGTELSEEEKTSKASSCGNCYKGDAFRCASCPFLGKPAFEPGMEKVVLAAGMDDF